MNKVIAFKSDVIQTVFLMGVLLFFTIITLIGLVINAMRQLSSLSGNDLTMTNVMPEKDPHVTVPYQDRGRRDGERLAAERCVFKKNGYQGRCLVQEVVVEHDQLKGECRRCPINWIHNCSDQ